MIRFSKANVTYPNGVSAMKDLDLEIDDGEFVVIVGLSGAGKSTLIRAVNGLVPLTSGELNVNGNDVHSLNRTGLRELRSDVGMIFQGFNLVDRTTVLKNVLMGRLHKVPTWRTLIGKYPQADIDIAARALERVEIIEKTYTRASDLSGGQRQQVAVGRALMTRPDVLMLDEPTAGVSPIVMDELFDRIIEIARTGIAILMVEQNAKQALAIADKGYVLVQGENRYTDTGEVLLENPDVRRAFLGG